MVIDENSLRNTTTGGTKRIAVSGALPDNTPGWGGNSAAGGQRNRGCLHLNVASSGVFGWAIAGTPIRGLFV